MRIQRCVMSAVAVVFAVGLMGIASNAYAGPCKTVNYLHKEVDKLNTAIAKGGLGEMKKVAKDFRVHVPGGYDSASVIVLKGALAMAQGSASTALTAAYISCHKNQALKEARRAAERAKRVAEQAKRAALRAAQQAKNLVRRHICHKNVSVWPFGHKRIPYPC